MILEIARNISLLALVLVLSSCVFEPEQGHSIFVDGDVVTLAGGSPFPAAYGKVELWNGSTFVQTRTFRGEDTIAPGMDEPGGFGPYYLWFVANVHIPSWAWHSNRARVKVSMADSPTGNWFDVYTYDETRVDCMKDASDPPSHSDWINCSHSSDGILNICRKGSTWTGSSCKSN